MVLGAGQLRDLVVPSLQVGDLVGQPVHVALSVAERCPLIGRDQLGHLLLHLLDGAQHVVEELLALLHGLLGRALDEEEGEGEDEDGKHMRSPGQECRKGRYWFLLL